MPARSDKAPKPSAKNGRLGVNRPAIERMQTLFTLIKAGTHPNCQSLCRALEVNEKTIRRDILFMRDRLGLPIEYDKHEHGYYLTEDVHAFPSIQVTQGELLALMVAEKAIAQYQGTPYHAQLESAFQKLLQPLDDMAGYVTPESVVSFRNSAPAVNDLAVFDRLTRAVVDQLEITFHYRKPGSKKPAPRHVQPLHLTHRESRWYMIGHDLDREAMRTYAVGRITQVELSARWFERPKDFSVERYFGGALGVMNGNEQHHVRIRFAPLAVDHVKDRFWHESQEWHPQPDGSLDLCLQLSDLLEVERLILQWGGHAVALEPDELRERLAMAGDQLLQAHGLRGSPPKPAPSRE
jgi:predicted DNA-binding transcriptional regulator YafY